MATVKTNTDVFEKAWEGFKGSDWKEKASVSRFVQANYTPYDGDESFLAGPTERSLKIKKIVDETKAGYEARCNGPHPDGQLSWHYPAVGIVSDQARTGRTCGPSVLL